MSFIDHLEELRWHLIRATLSIVVFSLTAFMFPRIVFYEVIFAPSRTDFISFRVLCDLSHALGTEALCITKLPFELQNRVMAGQFTMHIFASFIIGLIGAFPYAFWEIWRFVKPGLYQNEKQVTRFATFFVTLLFLTGVFFGYYIVSPLAINFLSNYQIDPSILNEIDITSYISTLAMVVLACGVMFQLPIVVYFLSKIGVLTPAFMRQYRKHAVVIILVVSAVITPPDPITQLFVAFPIFLLYQVSILISARVEKNAKKEDAAWEAKYGQKRIGGSGVAGTEG